MYPKYNLWVALVLFMDNMEPVLYLIPSKIIATTGTPIAIGDIFIDNEQGARFKHFSNWEIKVFTKAISTLSQYLLEHQANNLI